MTDTDRTISLDGPRGLPVRNVRMRALETFSKNLDGQIVVGDPDHPSEDGRYFHVSESAARTLEDADLAERYSLKDQARDEANEETAAERKEREEREKAEAHGADDGNVQGTTTAGTQAKESAQAARERRTDTSGSARGGRRRAPARGKAPVGGEKGGQPVGGTDTTASTNHPTQSIDGTGQADATNAGLNDAPDAAPTE